MKKFLIALNIVIWSFVITGCGTVGGAVSGAGQDFTKAGDWIKSKYE